MQVKASKKDFIWNYLGLFFRMGTSFLILPLLLTLLSETSLGLWYVFLAVNSFVTTFSAGFTPSFARLITYCWSGAKSFAKEGVPRCSEGAVDYGVFATLIIAAKRLYLAIAIVVFALITTFGTIYVRHVSSELLFTDYALPWFVFCGAVFLNIYYAYYESLLRGVSDFSGVNKATIISNIVWLLCALALLLAGFDLFACSLAFLIQGISNRLLSVYYFNKHTEIKLGINKAGKPTKEEVIGIIRIISPNSLKDTAVSIANYLMSTASTIVGSLYLSLADTGAYSVSLQLFNAIATISSVALTTYAPSLQSAYSNGDKQLEKRLTGRVYFGFVAVYVVLTLLLCTVGFPIISAVKPSFTVNWGLIALMAVYYFEWRLFSTSATLITYTNRIPYMNSFLVSAVLGVILSVVFVSNTSLGAVGLIAGQAVAQLYNVIKWPAAASRRVNASLLSLLYSGSKDALRFANEAICGVRQKRDKN